MAQQFRFECDACQMVIEAWDEADYYYLDDDGQKVHVYHPNHEGLAKSVGADVHHLCLDCSASVTVDTRVGAKPC